MEATQSGHGRTPEVSRGVPPQVEWIVYARAQIVATQFGAILETAGFSSWITPDIYRSSRRGLERSSTEAVVPLGTFSSQIGVEVEGGRSFLGSVAIRDLPNDRCTLTLAPDWTADKPWDNHEFEGWAHIPQVTGVQFARLGLEWDDTLAPEFRGPKPAGETRIAISRPSERSMWVDPAFSERLFNKRAELCFVLMPFDTELTKFYESAVKPVVQEFNMACERADDIAAGNTDILNDVWIWLNEARFMIADLTGRNANVYYELGIAHTLGKRVVSIHKKSGEGLAARLPFDVQNRRTIFDEDTASGADRFKDDLRRTIKTILESRA